MGLPKAGGRAIFARPGPEDSRRALKGGTSLATNGSPRTRRWRRIVWFVLLGMFLCLGAAFIFRFYYHRDARYCKRGQVYLEYGDTNNALMEFRAALKLNPKLMEARVASFGRWPSGGNSPRR